MFTLVARGPQGYKVVRYNAFRYQDLKEGSDDFIMEEILTLYCYAKDFKVIYPCFSTLK